MKDNTNKLSGTAKSGIVLLFKELQHHGATTHVPAMRLHLIGKHIVAKQIRVLVAHLLGTAERADSTCKPYGRSQLTPGARPSGNSTTNLTRRTNPSSMC